MSLKYCPPSTPGPTSLWVLFFLLLLPIQSQGAPFALVGQNGLRDEGGRRVLVQTPFRRIIALYGAHTENLFALGLDQEIIGVGCHDHYPPKVKDKNKFSYHDGVEKFLTARPDLILIRPMIDRAYAGLISRLEAQKITVLSFQPDNIQDMFLYWKILGRLTGREKEAQAMVDRFNQGLDLFRQLRTKIRKRKKVFFESIHRQYKTFSPGSMSIFALQCAGGINIADQAQPIRKTNIAAFGKERILANYKQIDVYLTQAGPMNKVSVQTIENEPGFEIIKAIKQKQVFVVKEELTSRPTLRLLLGIFEIGHALYPKLYNQQTKKLIMHLLQPSGRRK